MSDNRGRQWLLAEVEREEREQLVRYYWQRNTWTGGGAHGVSELLEQEWFQLLTIEEIREVSAIPYWEWSVFHRLDSITDEPSAEPTIRDVVEVAIIQIIMVCMDFAQDMVADELIGENSDLTENLTFVRQAAATYGFSASELAYQAIHNSR